MQAALVELGEFLPFVGAPRQVWKIWLNAVKVPASGALELKWSEISAMGVLPEAS